MKKLKALWNNLPDKVRRVLHTAWQVGLSTLLAHLLVAHSSQDVKSAFVVAGAVALATIKARLVG